MYYYIRIFNFHCIKLQVICWYMLLGVSNVLLLKQDNNLKIFIIIPARYLNFMFLKKI
jgi:hypothetical protein